MKNFFERKGCLIWRPLVKTVLIAVMFLSVGNANAQLTYVPDDNFEQALIDLGYDSGPLNNYVPTANISGIVTLTLYNKNISNLTGIEDFIALQYLDFSKNSVTTVNLSSLIYLINIICWGNNLTSLDFTGLDNITGIICSDNQLTTLDVSGLEFLMGLDCADNELISLIINPLTQTHIQGVKCRNNHLTTLNIANITTLEILDVSENEFTTLTLTGLSNLEFLNLSDNDITSIDLSDINDFSLLRLFFKNNPVNVDFAAFSNLEYLDIGNSLVTSLDLSNHPNLEGLSCDGLGLTSLDVRGLNLYYLICDNNDLTCILVDDPSSADANPNFRKDPNAIYSSDASYCDYTTKLITSQCTSTMTDIEGWLFVDAITGVGTISNYQIKIWDGVSPEPLGPYTSTSTAGSYIGRGFRIRTQAGVKYNTTYKVVAKADVNGDEQGWPDFDSDLACTVTTPATPAPPVLNPALCNQTLTSKSQFINFSSVYGAQQYSCVVTLGSNTWTYTSTGTSTGFKLTDSANFSPSFSPANSTTYSVTPCVIIDGVPTCGDTCEITTPPGPSPRPSNAMAFDGNETSEKDFDQLFTAYPNPFTNTFSLNTDSTLEGELTISIYDMRGRQLDNAVVKASDLTAFSFGSNYASGIYNVIVSQGGNTKSLKMIKK